MTVLLAILAIWYVACVPMNVREVLTEAERAGAAITPDKATDRATAGTIALITANAAHLGNSWGFERPRLPAPHQVMQELYASIVTEEIEGRNGLVRSGWFSNRGLTHHAGLTLGATVTGFLIGAALGVALAIGIVYSRAMDLSVMPWAVISQTIPIVALAPMIIVVLYSIGLQGLLPKAVISAYLSFFPVAVGMVKGLRAPDPMQLDLMRTWNAGGVTQLWKLRLPASLPYLFASLKVGIAASLVGTIVAEVALQQGGLGARMLAGSYYGQTAQIWAALVVAGALAATLVWVIGRGENWALRRQGLTP
jgi:NitT/TauT family transport system permease protein